MTVKIICINKDGGNHDNPYEAISHLEWVEDGTGKAGRSTRLEMYDHLKFDGWTAYVTDGIYKVYVYPAVTPRGTKYVRTESDGRETNNLLSLPEC